MSGPVILRERYRVDIQDRKGERYQPVGGPLYSDCGDACAAAAVSAQGMFTHNARVVLVSEEVVWVVK